MAFDGFDDEASLTPMRPELAISYFKALTPALQISEPAAGASRRLAHNSPGSGAGDAQCQPATGAPDIAQN